MSGTSLANLVSYIGGARGVTAGYLLHQGAQRREQLAARRVAIDVRLLPVSDQAICH